MNRNKLIGIICGAVVAIAAITGIVVIVVNNNNSDSNNANNSSNSSSEIKNDSASPIVGKWKYYDEDFGSLDFIYTFNADGTGDYDVSGTSKTFTYKIDGKEIDITYDESKATFSTEFEINGDIINIKDSGGNDTFYKKI